MSYQMRKRQGDTMSGTDAPSEILNEMNALREERARYEKLFADTRAEEMSRNFIIDKRSNAEQRAREIWFKINGIDQLLNGLFMELQVARSRAISEQHRSDAHVEV